MLPSTLQFLIAMIGCAINERLQRKLDYSQQEVMVLRETINRLTDGKRLTFTVEQRRRLATAGKALSPAERRSCCQIVKPVTLLAWYRQYCGRKYDSSASRPGRPRKEKSTRELVIELARDNLGWGYTKIWDALQTGLGIVIGRTTVANILAEAGIEPAPERKKKRTWKQFMKMHWESLYACDFFSVEVLVPTGTYRCLVFFVLEINTRAVEICGIRINPDGEWMKQMARNPDGPGRWVPSLKHQWLFLNTLDSVTRVRALAEFYVDEHNTRMPHPAFSGQTPDEMFFENGAKVLAELALAKSNARAARMAANRAMS